jgi:HSP20 family protein
MARTLARWDPFAEIADMRGRFDRLLDEFGPGRERGWSPAIDLSREEGRLVVRADVPGIKPEQIKIEIADNVLTLSGEHEETKEEKEKDFIRRERRYGAFSRSMTLPEGVDPSGVTAKTQEGVLEITIPLPVAAPKETVTITPSAAD